MDINVLIQSLMAGLVTGLGAVICLLIKKPTNKILSLVLGFAAGIMIGISLFSLIPHSLTSGNPFFTVVGFILGGFLMGIIDPLISRFYNDKDNNYLRMGIFIAIGMAIHDLPEGMAIGASSLVSKQLGFFTSLTIGLHNIAEGLAIALPLILGKSNYKTVIFITTMTGLSTFFGTIFGFLLISVSPQFIAASMSFAAGAMIYIASDELIPHSHDKNKRWANIGIMIGIAITVLSP